MTLDPALTATSIPLGSRSRPFWFRSGSHADQEVLRQVFTRQEYALGNTAHVQALQAYYQWILLQGLTPLILDAGANMGASAVWFRHTFPEAHVMAVEPDPGNAALLRRNCEGLDVEVIEGGIAARDGRMRIVNPEAGAWAYRLGDQGVGPEVRVFSASGLVARARAQERIPFLFKCDIEGGEGALFAEDRAWMEHFPLFILELHDWMLPWEGTSRSFQEASAALGLDVLNQGENVFCYQGRLLRDAAERLSRLQS